MTVSYDRQYLICLHVCQGDKPDVFSGLAGSLLVAIAVPVTAWFFRDMWKYRQMTSFKLSIKIPKELAAMPFSVRHVRDGAGELLPAGLAYKVDLLFPAPDESGYTCQELTFPSHAGVMFKVYVSCGDADFDEVTNALISAGYESVELDAIGKLKNAWFIIPDYAKITHNVHPLNRAIIDNFYVD